MRVRIFYAVDTISTLFRGSKLKARIKTRGTVSLIPNNEVGPDDDSERGAAADPDRDADEHLQEDLRQSRHPVEVRPTNSNKSNNLNFI